MTTTEPVPRTASRGGRRGRSGRGRGGARGQSRDGGRSASQSPRNRGTPRKMAGGKPVVHTTPSANETEKASTDKTAHRQPPPKKSARARSFGAQLTSGEAPEEEAPRVRRDYADLRERLVAELTAEDYDCVICYNSVKRKQPVWSCSRCYAVLHLSCVRTWAERSVAQVEERNAMHQDEEVRLSRGHWRCPGCQVTRQDVPRKYLCWCGRTTQPRGSGMPHGCGGRCTRGCAWHGCGADICHPGPCPPCAASVRVACYCGRAPHLELRCSQLRAALGERAHLPLGEAVAGGAVSCGAVCGRELACGRHVCTRPCHAGPCAPCDVELHDAPCHCGRHTRTMRCGARSADAYGLASAWACDEPCAQPLACGHHVCSKTCHVRTGVAPCPRDPQRVRTCPCGRMPVTGRADCREPIPTCGAACRHVLPCGHKCSSACHEGPCPPCTEQVAQVCRCGATKRHVMCQEITAAPGRLRDDAHEASAEYLCEAVCRAQRHCGKHQCRRRCCPLAYQAGLVKKVSAAEAAQLDPLGLHACDVPCRRPLACGRHVCEASCHRGACPPCLRSSFTEVACTCGRTVLEPPVPCGTEVQCPHPCALPDPACGHPKVPHSCHPPSVPCPPCVHLTHKTCVCGRSTLPAVPCSRPAVRCGLPCRALLTCQLHRCPGTCHGPGECAPCSQPCGQPRASCGHACTKPCHAPAPCDDDTPCDAVVVRRCPCGHREKLEVCGASRTGRSPPAPLECTPSCTVAQRNARFARALGLSKSEAGVSYAPALVQFVAAEPRAAQAVQDALGDFVTSPRAASQLRALLTSLAQRRGTEPVRVTGALLSFAAELARAYGLETDPCTPQGLERMGPTPANGRDADLRVRRARDSRIPRQLLTEYAVTQPARAALEARRARLSQLPHARPPRRVDAIVLSDVPPALRDAPQVLASVLAPATRGGRRQWHMEHKDGTFVLRGIVLEPLSLADVASASVPPAMREFSPPERRIVALREEVAASLAAAGAAATVDVGTCVPELYVHRGAWQPWAAVGGRKDEASAPAPPVAQATEALAHTHLDHAHRQTTT